MPAAPNEIARMNYQVSECECECLILGSSRASHHYVSKIIEDSLRIASYNAGRNGHGISYANGVLRAILTRKKPKLVILEFSDGEFRPDWTEKVGTLKPYFNNYPEILQLAENILGKEESLKARFGAYRFNSLVFPVLGTFLQSSKDKGKGYMPLKGRNDSKIKIRASKGQFTINQKERDVLNDFVGICRKNNIEIIAFCSPIYQDFSYERIELARVCVEYRIPFYDYSNDKYYINHPELFWDNAHLNEEGAQFYTKEIISTLKQVISEIDL